MTVTDVKRQIMDATTANFYIFTGEELAVQNIYVGKIAEVKGQIVKRVDSVKEALTAKGASLFQQSFCYVCRDDMAFIRGENEATWEKVSDLLGQNTLILLFTALDKRGKFYKAYEQEIVTFNHLDPYVLRKYIRQEVEVPKETANRLIEACECDYSRLMLELDKARQLSNTEELCGIQSGAIIEMLLDDGTISLPPQDAIFDWVDAVLDGKPRLAFRLYEECQKMDEPTLRLLLVLYNNTKQLLQVQGCTGNIGETTGLSGWEIRNAQKHTGIYSNRELVSAIRLIKSVETDIKTGQMEEQWAVPYVMTSIIGGY